MKYYVDVRIEMRDADTGKVITWDTDTFSGEGDRADAQAFFDRIAEGAGRAAQPSSLGQEKSK